MPTLNNYTISDAVFSVVEGSNIYDTQQTATLVISPNTGYTVDANDFYRAGSIPSFVEDYEFVQDGDNVNLILTFVDGFTMPSNNLIGEFCIGGSAVPLLYMVKDGVRFYSDANSTWDSIDISFSEFGQYGETIRVLTNTVTANSGSKLTGTSVVFDFPNENFTYTENKTYDIDGNWISSTFSIFYTFPAYDWNAGNGSELYTSPYFINVNATSEEIYMPLPEVTAYVVSTNSIPSSGGDIVINVYGNPGAVFSIEQILPTSGEFIAEDFELTNYSQTFEYSIPSVTSNTTRVFQISGDISSSFNTSNGQSDSFTIYQNLPISITFDATGTNLEGAVPVVRTYNTNSAPINGSYYSFANIVWEIVSSTNNNLNIIKEIETEDWLNLTTITRTLTSDCINSTNIELDDTTGITSGMLLAVANFSDISVISIVDSNNIIVSEPVTYITDDDIEFSTSKNSSVIIDSIMEISEDFKTVTVSSEISIIQYGSEDITFELNLDNIIEEVADTGNTTGFISATFDNSDACSLTLDNPIWLQDGANRVFSDSSYTIPFDGGGNIWKLKRDDNDVEFSAEIDTNGYISLGFICAPI